MTQEHLLNAAWRYSNNYRKIGKPTFTWPDSPKRDQAMPVSESNPQTAAKLLKNVLKREVDKTHETDKSSSKETDDHDPGSDWTIEPSYTSPIPLLIPSPSLNSWKDERYKKSLK